MLEKDSWAACREDHKEGFEIFLNNLIEAAYTQACYRLFLKNLFTQKIVKVEVTIFTLLKNLYLEDKSSLLEQANICWRLVFSSQKCRGNQWKHFL